MKTDFPYTRDLVLVGGGHAHAILLKMWAMAPLAGARLTLINPAPSAPYSGMLPGFVAGHYTSEELYIDLVRLARAAGARVILGKVSHVDRALKQVHVAGRPPIGYDVCSVDIGITSGMPELDGFSEHAVPAKPLDDFARIWDGFCRGTGDAEVAVLGAGVAGAEVAMAAAHHLQSLGRTAQVSLIDRSRALGRLGTQARKKVLASLDALGVDLIEHAKVLRVESDHIEIEGRAPVLSQLTLGAAGARAYDWISELGLAVENGYLRVGPTLQSESDPSIFAVGDCAHLSHAPRPKAGVFAVREAPVLFHNLRAALTGGAMKEYHPQSDYLKLISLGGKKALAEKRGLAVSGTMMWRWKDQIDRKFMRQFDDLKPMVALELPSEHARGSEAHRSPICAGCGSKVGRGALTAAFDHNGAAREDVVALPGDDAALLQMDGLRQVLSTDHLRAFCDDPVVMTRIAAVHALGDIWSMGAAPQSAMVSLILPRMSADLQERTLAEIMETASEVMGAAGAQIIGGHTSMGAEFTIGFSVTGIADAAPITLNGAQAGDVLILTKPIGTGVILAAEMQMRALGTDVARAFESMSRPLARDAEALAGAHAMTDVTGFGLAGHLANICRSSSVGAELDARVVPLLSGALEMSEAGVQSSLYPDNLSDALPLMNAPKTARGRLMLDPQTAGGLLAALPENAVENALKDLQDLGIEAVQIGRIIEGPMRLKLIE
ncbi:selenide, water dikinase SelD [Planktotalea sp.]|uniref:selenide, water dikinase SelD n=1 Tax=Planktotalea sp. TaxID=2029877 RepID=UPI0025E9B3A7|nr:selenide, water dikinase SelD [Planktotalea sp.]